MGPFGHPEVSMHTPPLSAYMDSLERGDWTGVADLMLASANKLADMGADFLICPDNTIHQALPQVLPRSPLSWLHIAEVVADHSVQRGFRRLGLTGTRWLVDGPYILTCSTCVDSAFSGRPTPSAMPSTASSLKN